MKAPGADFGKETSGETRSTTERTSDLHDECGCSSPHCALCDASRAQSNQQEAPTTISGDSTTARTLTDADRGNGAGSPHSRQPAEVIRRPDDDHHDHDLHHHRRTKAAPFYHHAAHEAARSPRAPAAQHSAKHAAAAAGRASYLHPPPRLSRIEHRAPEPGAAAGASSPEGQESAERSHEDEGVKNSRRDVFPSALSVPLASGSAEETVDNEPGAYFVLPAASDRPPASYSQEEEPTHLDRGSLAASLGADLAAEDDWIQYHRQDVEEKPPGALAGNLATFPTLVEASLVTEPELVEAEPMTTPAAPDAGNKGLLQRWVWVVLVLSVMAVALAIGLSVGLSANAPTGPSGDEAAAAASEALLRSILPNYTVAAFQNPASAPYLALRWATDDSTFLSTVPPEHRSRRLIQRFLLALLAYAFSSDPRFEPNADSRTWLRHDASECEWLGCQCTGQEVVRGIVVRALDLLGTMPREVGLLTSLEVVDTGNNSIGGPLPTEIGALTRLTDLRMDHTHLSRSIPTELARLNMLTTLLLDSTQFEGTVPSELGMLSHLERLDLSNIPSLGGTIPQELCQRVANHSLMLTVSCTMITCNCDCVCRGDENATQQ